MHIYILYVCLQAKLYFLSLPGVSLAGQSYTNGIRDDRGDITETEAEKLPLDECVHVLENQPMAFRNPHYDHLPEGAGQLTPSETSASPAVSPLVSEKVFFEEPEGSPSLKHSGPPSPVSNSSGGWVVMGLLCFTVSWKRLHAVLQPANCHRFPVFLSCFPGCYSLQRSTVMVE